MLCKCRLCRCQFIELWGWKIEMQRREIWRMHCLNKCRKKSRKKLIMCNFPFPSPIYNNDVKILIKILPPSLKHERESGAYYLTQPSFCRSYSLSPLNNGGVTNQQYFFSHSKHHLGTENVKENIFNFELYFQFSSSVRFFTQYHKILLIFILQKGDIREEALINWKTKGRSHYKPPIFGR